VTGVLEHIGRVLDTLAAWVPAHASIAVIAAVGVDAAIYAARRVSAHGAMRGWCAAR
jgi:hypothetical protein